jgi:3-phenylpropionate/trans-cinnamate dioxygenase ferredoxin reductase subunit
MAKHKMVVLGNGGAACHAICATRAAGFSGEIHMISDIREPAFNPMLAPYYLNGLIAWENCFPFGTDFYRRNHVTCHFGSPVAELDTERQTVKTEAGFQIAWDRCLVATGANAVIPPVPGLKESPFVYPLRTSASARHLESIMATADKAVVLGASLVGIKIAEIMSHKKARVIVVDVAGQVMPRGAHPETAGYLQAYLEQHGIEFLLGCAMEGLEEKESGVCCFFPESVVEDADFVGVCTGIRSNLHFVDSRQVEIDLGILIDAHCQTSVDGLFAAGDCAQGLNPVTGRKEWQGTWMNACCQGRTAGLNMAGQSARFEGLVSQHISPVFDWIYAQLGDVNVTGASVRVECCGHPFEGEGKFRLLVYEGERLVGANLVNCPEEIPSLKHAISYGLPWKEENRVPAAYLQKAVR